MFALAKTNTLPWRDFRKKGEYFFTPTLPRAPVFNASVDLLDGLLHNRQNHHGSIKGICGPTPSGNVRRVRANDMI